MAEKAGKYDTKPTSLTQEESIYQDATRCHQGVANLLAKKCLKVASLPRALQLLLQAYGETGARCAHGACRLGQFPSFHPPIGPSQNGNTQQHWQPKNSQSHEFLAVQSASRLYKAKMIDVQHIDIQMHTYRKPSNNAHHIILPAKSTVTVTF